MVFDIERASDIWRSGQPVEGARLAGKEKDGVPIWTIEVNNLEELISLREKVGRPLIIGRANQRGERTITIYDDLIE